MKFAGALAALCASLTVGACVAGAPPGPMGIVMPGKDKTEAVFQQDESICQQHATAHTGYGDPSQQSAGTAPTAPPPASSAGTTGAAVPAGGTPLDELGYMQCMAARGDVVQMASMDGYASAYPYTPAYPYPYAYPDGYGFPDGYPFGYPYYAGFVGGFGWWHGGWGGHHAGWGHPGFHGGWAHAGFHGGGHSGGGHSGGGGHH
jgi:hypothetical protein